MSKTRAKSKRKTNGQFAGRQSPFRIAVSWIAGIVSLVLPYASGRLLLADLAAFRSCNTNDDGLRVVSCGKHNVNFSDLLFLLLFGLSVALVYSLFTAAWRITRRIAV